MTTPQAMADHEGQRLWSAWIGMWNGEVDAGAIVSDDFRIWFAGGSASTDDIRGPVALQSFVTTARASRPGLRFASVGSPITSGDPVNGRVVSRWNRHLGTEADGGTDVLEYRDGCVVMAWSVTGERPWPDERIDAVEP